MDPPGPVQPGPRAPVTDPIFGKDIGFFLFQLPFLRLVQGLVSGLLVASLVVSSARYLRRAARGAVVFHRRVRVHLAVLGGLFLLSVARSATSSTSTSSPTAPGASRRGSFTDQNAQFFAFDLLTILSALAGGVLVGAAFARRLLPLAVTVGVWLVASIVVGRLYPEAIQRFTVAPNQFAQESPYIAQQHRDDPARLRPRQVGGPQLQRRGRADAGQIIETRPTRSATLGCGTTGRSATTLDQLQTVRRYYTSPTSTRTATASMTTNAR